MIDFLYFVGLIIFVDGLFFLLLLISKPIINRYYTQIITIDNVSFHAVKYKYVLEKDKLEKDKKIFNRDRFVKKEYLGYKILKHFYV